MKQASWLKSALVAAVISGLAACGQPYPADIRGSLDEARESALEVGVSEAGAWISWNEGSPTGVEADLIRSFAEQEGLEVEWIEGEETELLEALKGGDLHIVAGGLTKATPWKKHVSLSEPISTCRVYAGLPDPAAPSLSEDELKSMTLRVERASGLAHKAEKKGYTVERVATLEEGSGGAIAEEFTLADHGLTPVGDPLLKTTHVLAVPHGENALYAALTRSLPAKPGCLAMEESQ